MKRPINGVLLLDKPSGITSHTAMQSVKRLFQAKKAGHTGSLDPLASGLLPICLGEATKFSQYLLDADKSYVATARFGICTSTGDSEGEIISQREIPPLSLDLLNQTLKNFLGTIDQIPPMVSALKHRGKPLYQWARQGITVDRPARRVTIFALNIRNHDHSTAELFVHCSKGTYIRSLVEDWGNALGCGAHVIQLRRVGVADYSAAQMITLDQLQSEWDPNQPTALDRYLLPLDAALQRLPLFCVDERLAVDLQCGKRGVLPHPMAAGLVRLENPRKEFMGIGEISGDGTIVPKRLVSFRLGE